MILRFIAINLILLARTHNAEHLSAANWANASHGLSFFAALTFHADFFRVFHFSFLLTFYAICLHEYEKV